MPMASRGVVLQLYRDLLRYGRKLEFTDKEYYFLRIRHEFQFKKDIKSSEEIDREIKVRRIFLPSTLLSLKHLSSIPERIPAAAKR